VAGAQRHAVWVLGETDGMDAALQAQGLDLLPAAPWIETPSDWRTLLFDLALTSPPGQLASPGLRGEFLARRLRRAALGLSALGLALTLWGVSAPLRAGMQAQDQRTLALAELRQEATAQAAIEQDIQRFGVAPALLRRAIRLNEEEVSSAPKLAESLTQLATSLGRSGPYRVGRLEWRLLAGREPACVKAAQAAGNAALAHDAAPAMDEHRAELELTLPAEPDSSGRGRAQKLLKVSTSLGQWPGARLWLDPAQRAATDVLSSSAQGEVTPPTWCLSLAQLPARAAPTAP
jgi:GNAT superfamily N-acetyltransferase